MLRVGLVTTWNEMCGIAEYSRNLVSNCKDIEFKILGRPYEANSLIQRAADCDVVNFQYESGFLGIFHPGVMKSFNKPTVLTLHDSHPENNRQIYPFTNEADVVIVHEKTNDNFVHIPQPIATDEYDSYSWIGGVQHRMAVTAGFPLPWKGFELLAESVKILTNIGVLTGGRFIGPRNPHCDTYQVQSRVKQICQADYITEFYPQAEVIRLMHECVVSVFPYYDGKPGISSAVRLGLVAGRPIVLSRCRQFRDLFDYEDEIEFVEGTLTPASLARAIAKVLESGKHPKSVLKDMSWERAASLYSQVYNKVAVCV